jgi:peptidoglycan/xylan/chitin deacetylase (PgdA/CDA1 family)
MSIEATAKAAIGALAASPVARPLVDREFLRRVNVAYYHHIGPSTPYYAEFYAGTSTERLDRDLTLLAGRFEFGSLEDVIATNGSRPPRLAITFDDGFDLFRDGAVDMLEAHGVKATVFVITSCVGNRQLMWRNKLSAIRALTPPDRIVTAYGSLAVRAGLKPITAVDRLLDASSTWAADMIDEYADELWLSCDMPPLREFLDEQRPYMTWEQLREWIRRGHSVGLHTHTHPYCSRLDDDGIRRELLSPALLLRKELALESIPLSYPFGDRLPPDEELRLYDEGVVSCALGIEGLSRVGTPPYRLERAGIESQFRYRLFASVLLDKR